MSHKLKQENQIGLICVGYGYKEPDSHKWGPGCRDIYTLHLVLSGHGFVRVQGRTFPVEAGDSFLIFPEEEYYYYPDGQDPWEYTWVDFKGWDCERLLSYTGFNREYPVMSGREEAGSYFNMASEAADRIRREEEQSARLHLLLTYFFRDNLSKEIDNCKDYIQIAKEYMGSYYWKSDLSVPEIALQLHIDRTHLYRLFKNTLDLSPLEYLTELRMERAEGLLRDTSMSIQAVAASVGYEDALYFSKSFKKARGVSPSAYRSDS